MSESLVTIQLSVEEAELFKMFQKHYHFMNFLEKVKAFDMKDGHITIHFTKYGEIATFDLEERFNHFKLPLPI